MKKSAFSMFLLIVVFINNPTRESDQQVIQHTIRQASNKIEIIKIKEAYNIARSNDFSKVSKQRYFVEGYFIADPFPILVTDLKWFLVNSPMPDSVFIPVQGPAASVLMKNLKKYLTAKIRIECTISLENRRTITGKSYDMRFIDCVLIAREIIIIKERTHLEIGLSYLCKKYPEICRTSKSISNNYALLYSGGVNSDNAHSRYWNDLKFMAKTLKSKYGYTDEHIVVVYKDGLHEDSEMNVNFPASRDGVKKALDYLKTKMSDNSNLFLFITNHGGGFNTSKNININGCIDVVPKDEAYPCEYDETIFYFNEVSNTISDDSLALFINNTLNGKKLIALFETCYGGGLIRDLRGPNHILTSAAGEHEPSEGDTYDIFSYYFTSALNGANDEGETVNADTNKDGKVSFLEAFLYARDHDYCEEHPLLEDNGDGERINYPSATGTSDGAIADKTFL